MKIGSVTMVTKSEEFTVTKSIGGLILAIEGFPLSTLATEKISIYIERANGSNVILANKVLLKDFILASTYGSSATQSDFKYHCIAVCELAHLGGIALEEKESIKIQLDDLNPSVGRYDIFGIEEPIASSDLYFFEQKTVASEQFSKIIDVKGFDLAIMTTHDTVQDVSYRYSNGVVVKYLPFELQSLSRDIDPIQALNGFEVVQGLTDRVSLPLEEVDTIEVNKSQGAVINFVVRSIKNV